MYEPNYHYIPCRCFSADHLVRVCPDEDIDGTLNVEILSSRQSSFWSRVRWALKHVFGREDLVFADVIVSREKWLKAAGEAERKEAGK
ncbi:hypothetical protein I6H96_11570 [Brucella anthropi]|nr:hypothetical protein [Brucella anthropi]NKC47613.1 hypothetical protein [Brucella anthropi ATCC 49188]QQC24817.1 hypothetical protein I6H96_11570 [Brucella anthropi]SUA60159.1 Uncharacterised protein [Brucella anthropi]HBQ33111.1 hypothetical protein [Brucella anthropi]